MKSTGDQQGNATDCSFRVPKIVPGLSKDFNQVDNQPDSAEKVEKLGRSQDTKSKAGRIAGKSLSEVNRLCSLRRC
ncbi:hypothetical protein ACROYT_G013727 [Oculina patagonica]